MPVLVVLAGVAVASYGLVAGSWAWIIFGAVAIAAGFIAADS